jgi:hypothetical protein
MRVPRNLRSIMTNKEREIFMNAQLIETNRIGAVNTPAPHLRAVVPPESKKRPLIAHIGQCCRQFINWVGAWLAYSDRDIEAWKRTEFRNEYQERREQRYLDLYRWF